jgi:hypothetical protein
MIVRRRQTSTTAREEAIQVLECRPPEGPMLVSFREWLQYYADSEEIAWRKLMRDQRTRCVRAQGLDDAVMEPALQAIIGAGMRYPTTLRIALGRAFPSMTRAVYANCTDTVGWMFSLMGLIPTDCDVHRWTPDHFSSHAMGPDCLGGMLQACHAGTLAPERRVDMDTLHVEEDRARDEQIGDTTECGHGARGCGGGHPGCAFECEEMVHQQENAQGSGQMSRQEAHDRPPSPEENQHDKEDQDDGSLEPLPVGEGLTLKPADGHGHDGDKQEVAPEEDSENDDDAVAQEGDNIAALHR